MHKTSKWMLHAKKADFNAIGERFKISPITARILRNRGLIGEKEIDFYLNGTMDLLHSPFLLKDMEKAIQMIQEKIVEKKPIRIIGDYDIDGICSTYLLYQGLKRCGANVDYQIPERMKDGYGINETIIKKAGNDSVDTLITCDNGIAARKQIQFARELGLTVIITDHHEVPMVEGKESLPPANAIINPKQHDCNYPFEGICGGVVAYKLIQALYETMGVPRAEWEGMVEIAAIATVGDVMQLKDENRIIVKYGLKSMESSKSIGLHKLIEACNLEYDSISSYHIGFVIGPCLNASGRLKTAELALELLLCKQEEKASEMAMELRVLNEERKDLTAVGLETAIQQVESLWMEDRVLVVYLEDCHESLAGIIAGRLRERYYKPSLVLTKAEEGAKGSGRSISGYHMYEELVKVDQLLEKYGGHPMAAGFSLNCEQIEEFRKQLNENCQLTEQELIPQIWIDVPMPFEYISESLIRELKLLEPFGQGNEKPQFAQKNLTIRNSRVFGKRKNVVKLSLVTPEGYAMEGIIFTDGEAFEEEQKGRTKIDIIYYPDLNEYNGNKTLQVVIQTYQWGN